MRPRSWITLTMLLLLSATVGLMYFRAQNARGLADPVRARAEERPIPVRTGTVEEADQERVIGGTAVTVPSETAVIQFAPLRAQSQESSIEVVVKSVHVQDGDYVRNGQLLFEMDDRVLREIVKQREVALAAAEAVLRARTEHLQKEQELLDFVTMLRENQVYSEMRLMEAKTRFAAMSSQVHEARAAVEVLVSELEVARRDVERLQIRSPLEGFISEVAVVPGALIATPTVLARVLKLNPLHVMMNFPQERLPEAFVGQAAEVVLDSNPQETFAGTVTRIMPEVNTELRVLPVLIELRNPQNRLKAGIAGFARLRIRGKAVSVPSSAVIQQGSKAMVFRVEDGRARLREVSLGPATDHGWRRVENGLELGDEVVIFHNFYRRAGELTAQEGYLQDGDLVDTDWRAWARRE